jgi:energy-coupling factor transporter ATP-binding protein EcfA2
MSTYDVNLPNGAAAVGDNATLNIYNIGPVRPDRPTLRPTLRNAVAPLMNRHEIFGGRQKLLSELTTSVEQRPGGYVFVTGPSGYGKTALLVHLVRSLQQRGEEPVYHFISQRDAMLSDADLCFRSLCQQLIARHGLGGDLPSSTADVRFLYPVLLGIPPAQGSRTIVVLDGLDEASQWSDGPGPDMYPVSLPSGVHVVFSAREVADHDWLGELGLGGRADVRRLGTLDVDGVRDVLYASKAKPLQTAIQDGAFVKAVHEVSGGDPFYLHFLAEDLAKSADVTETVVRQQPRGLNAYLDRWWIDVAQKAAVQPAVENVLGYLAVAR